jgi:hypothetical protein
MTVSGLSLNMNNFRNFVSFVIILGIFFVFLHPNHIDANDSNYRQQIITILSHEHENENEKRNDATAAIGGSHFLLAAMAANDGRNGHDDRGHVHATGSMGSR